MADNYINESVGENELNYGGANYQGNPYPGGDTGANAGTYFNVNPSRNYQRDPRMTNTPQQNFNQGANPGYNGMYNNSYRPANVNQGSYNPGYQGYYGQPPQGNYNGDGRMSYTYDDDYEYDYHNPHCHYYYPHHFYNGPGYAYNNRPMPVNYRGYRTNRRYRPNTSTMYGSPNRPNIDPYYDQSMNPSSWMNWMNPNVVSDFIQRPRVNNFLRGVGIATVGMLLAPSTARVIRPLIVKAVKGAMTATDEIRSIFTDAKEDIEDIFAEAKWDSAKHERHHQDGNETPNG